MTKPKSPTPPLTKREKFEKAGRFPWKRIAIIAVIIVLAAGGFTGYRLATQPPEVGGEVVEEAGVDYAATGPVEMVGLSGPTVLADTIELSASEITSKRIGGVLYSRTNPMPAGYDDLPDNGLPILAYVAPSGRLVVATSLCEPCHSYNFHIEGDNLVCNACFSRWDLDTLEAVAGGCQAYPPQELKTVVQGDKVVVDKAILENWEPRA